MPRRPRKVHERRDTLTLGDLNVPVRVITELGRNGSRAAINTKAVIIRLPGELSPRAREAQLQNMIRWVEQTYADKPEAFAHFRSIELALEYAFNFRGDVYRIEVDFHELQSHRINQVEEYLLEVYLNAEDPRAHDGKLLPKLLAKFFAGVKLPSVTQRVHELNDLHFQRPINNVKLSDTYTRWGSCSSKGNINLATRLLLAPDEVLDAVIIHELAHLVEANHSPRFWAQVARALPNYREYDEWLKLHGKELLFVPTVVDEL